MNFHTLQWKGDTTGFLELLDQRRLPTETVYINCQTVPQLWDCIKTLAVRGAPAIGVSAAYGVCIAAKDITEDKTLTQAAEYLDQQIDYLATSRPTAVNLFWALERMRKTIQVFIEQNDHAEISDLQNRLLTEADQICHEDKQMCEAIGKFGEQFIPQNGAVLTHCNAGALATAGCGTALAPMFEAKKAGKQFRVYCDETRPLLQGARLTAWELKQADIETYLICDNTAGWLMKQKMIDAVITGADRIASNGDTANKIGTYSLSILARGHNIPFYIAAPTSTFDMSLADGSAIPIEQRDRAEVTHIKQNQLAPAEINVYNAAFDVTQAADIAAIITEKGIIPKPDTQKIRQMLET